MAIPRYDAAMGGNRVYDQQSEADQAAYNSAAAPGGTGTDLGTGRGNINEQGSWAGESNDADVERYRRLGAQTQAPVQIDQTQANESRGLQVGALGLLRAQAEGTAPSASAILAQRANQTGAAAAGRAGLGGIAALRHAQPGIASQTLTANAANANQRGAEISHGQGQYASSAQGMEGQDIQAAIANAQLQAQQNAINKQRQQGFERLGWDTRNAALQGDQQIWQQNVDQQAADLAARRAGHAADVSRVKDIYGGAAGIATGILSDPRTKTCVAPISALSNLRRKAQ